jgi:hypothetical protein
MFAIVQVLPMEYRNYPNMNTVHTFKIKRSRRDGMIDDISRSTSAAVVFSFDLGNFQIIFLELNRSYRFTIKLSNDHLSSGSVQHDVRGAHPVKRARPKNLPALCTAVRSCRAAALKVKPIKLPTSAPKPCVEPHIA